LLIAELTDEIRYFTWRAIFLLTEPIVAQGITDGVVERILDTVEGAYSYFMELQD
jgi:hypothetical protein